MKSLKRKNKSWLYLISSFLFIIGFIFLYMNYFDNKKIEDCEKQAIDEYYNQQTISEPIIQDLTEEVKTTKKINYVAVLKIPKINLEKGLVDRNSYLNNVKYNIQILKESSMPDETNGNVILASHSGNSKVSFFKNLNKLEINDNVIIDYKNVTYTYKVVYIYEIDKTGTAVINRNNNKNTLTMITCKSKTNKQIVIICEEV